DKLGVYDTAAAAHDGLVGHVHHVHDAEMHKADFRAVVIDHSNCGVVHLVDGDLLHQLAAHSVLVAMRLGEEAVIFLRDMAANPNRIQSMQAGFLAAFAP